MDHTCAGGAVAVRPRYSLLLTGEHGSPTGGFPSLGNASHWLFSFLKEISVGGVQGGTNFSCFSKALPGPAPPSELLPVSPHVGTYALTLSHSHSHSSPPVPHPSFDPSPFWCPLPTMCLQGLEHGGPWPGAFFLVFKSPLFPNPAESFLP